MPGDRVPTTGWRRVLLLESRIWVCAARWLTRRAPTGRTFGYGANLRSIVRIVLALVVFEAVVVEVLLVLLLGSSPWVWLGLALHLYGLVWILGFLGSLRVLPHRIDGDALVLHDSVFGIVRVPLAVVARVQLRRRGAVGRSGFRVDDGVALLAYGDTNVRVTVDSAQDIRVDGVAPPSFSAIDLSLDDPAAFTTVLREEAARVRDPAGHGPR